MNPQESKTLFSQRTLLGICVAALLLLAGQISLVLADTTGSTGGNAVVENRQPTLGIEYIISLNGVYPDHDPDGDPNLSAPPDRTQPFLGEIKAVPIGFLPQGWVPCDGRLLPLSQYSALFGMIGQTYGGDGKTNFALPDLQGRVPMGVGERAGEPYDLGQQVGFPVPLDVTNLPSHTHTLPGGGTTAATGSGAPTDNHQEALVLNFLIASDGEIMITPWIDWTPPGWTFCDGRLLSVSGHSYLYSYIGNIYGGNATNFAVPDMQGRILMGSDGAVWPLGFQYGTDQIVLGVSDIPAHAHTIPAGTTGATGGGGSTNNYQPSLVMRWMISPFGSTPAVNADPTFPMVSEIRIIAGATSGGLPSGQWLQLDGSFLSTSAYPDLYNAIGTTFGGGSGTFAIPDLRGIVAAKPQSGTLVLGQNVGGPKLVSSVAELAAHTHSFINLRIIAIQYFSDSSAQLTLNGTVGQTCQVDKSDDLATWSNLGQVNFTTATQPITDPNQTQAGKRFYKAHIP